MLGFLKTTTGKLLGGIAVTVAGWELWSRHRASVKSYVLQPGTDYAVVLHYTGAGAGGPLSAAQIQSYLASAGPTVGIVGSTATDPASKTVSYRLSTTGALQALAVAPLSLIGPTFPAAFGTVTVQSVTALGTSA